MNKKELNQLFESMTPDEQQKARMVKNMQNNKQGAFVTKTRGHFHRMRIVIPTVCIVLAAILVSWHVLTPTSAFAASYSISAMDLQEKIKVKLADNVNTPDKYPESISIINARPDLEFFLGGDSNIAKIEISCKNEFLYLANTPTFETLMKSGKLHVNYSQPLINVGQYFDKSMTLSFADDFTAYDDIWYRWDAWHLYTWATQDNYSHFNMGGPKEQVESLKSLDSQEALELAAGDKTSVGHIQLAGYPEELLKDQIKITITDRAGASVSKIVNIQISNNQIGQTVVTASVEK